jgi:hypothetical protein
MKILGYQYGIIRDRNSEEMGSMGKLHVKPQKIQIATDLTEQQEASTVLHEIIEALAYHLEMKLDHQDVMGLEAGLYQVLTDNGIDLSPLARAQ